MRPKGSKNRYLSASAVAAAMALVAALGGPPAARGAGASATPDSVDALVQQASDHLAQGQPDLAIEALQRALELAPDSAEAWFLLGRAHTRRRDYGPAHDALERAIALGDSSMRTRFFLAAVLWEQGQLDEAEVTYRAALEAPGDPTQVLAQLGRLLLWQGRYQEALDPLRLAAERAPGAVEVLYDLAEALRGAGLGDEAIEIYRRVTELAPDLLKARYGLAVLLAARGDRAGSEAEFAVYRRLYEEDQQRTRLTERRDGELDRARDLLGRGAAAEAARHLEELPETVDGLMLLATAYGLLGRDEDAVGALERAVVLDPSRADLRRALGERRAQAAEGGDR